MQVSLILLGCLLSFQAWSQSQDSLIAELLNNGSKNYEEGRLDLALIEYDRILQIDAKHPLANYEMASCYYAMGNDHKALKHASIASKDQSEVGIEATILKGGIIDQSGKSKKAMKVFEKGLKRFGDYYLLWYHYGISATNADELEKASMAYQSALKTKLDHTESHFALARLMLVQKRQVEAIYPLMFYLMLNPKGETSLAVCNSLNKLLTQSEPADSEAIKPNKAQSYSFQLADFLLRAFVDARNLEEYSSRSKLEADAEILSNIFEYLAAAPISDEKSFYSSYYIPFFNQIADNGFINPLMHYIFQSSDEESKIWVENHTSELEKMFEYLDQINVK